MAPDASSGRVARVAATPLRGQAAGSHGSKSKVPWTLWLMIHRSEQPVDTLEKYVQMMLSSPKDDEKHQDRYKMCTNSTVEAK